MLRFGKNVNAALVAALIMLVVGTTASADAINETSSISHRRATAHWVAPQAPEIWPNDPSLAPSLMFDAYKNMDLPKAWAVTTCSPSVKVAIIDTGLNSGPWDPDLVPNQPATQATHNGVDGSADVTDATREGLKGYGHGAMSSQVGFAVGNNGFGTAGVCWHAQFLMAKYTPDWTSWDAITADIYWAVSQNVRVIDLEMEAERFTPSSVIEASKFAYDHGVVVVVAAGNQGSDKPAANTLASSMPWAIRVGEYYPGLFGSGSELVSGSNHGDWVDVSADDTMPYMTPNGLQRAGGTSTSVAVVAGLVAMLLSYDPSLNPDQVKQYAMASCVQTSSDPPIDVVCKGHVNALKMLMAAGYVPPKQLTVKVSGNGTIRVNGQKATTKKHVFYFAAGTAVELRAKAAAGWHLVGWQGVRPKHQQDVNLQLRWTKTVTAVFVRNLKK